MCSEKLDIHRQAFYIFFQFLMRRVQDGVANHLLTIEAHHKFLRNLLRIVEELLGVEGTCKWLLVAFCELVKALQASALAIPDETIEWNHRRLEALKKLCVVDYKHSQRYRYIMASVESV